MSLNTEQVSFGDIMLQPLRRIIRPKPIVYPVYGAKMGKTPTPTVENSELSSQLCITEGNQNEFPDPGMNENLNIETLRVAMNFRKPPVVILALFSVAEAELAIQVVLKIT